MSLYGSLMADVEDDPFFGSHMRHMRQMNNMMNSLFSDPFGMLGGMMGGGMSGGPLAIGGPRHGNAMMPYMPQMPQLNRLFTGDMDGGMGVMMGNMGNMANMGMGGMNAGSSFSSSTVVMSSGPNGKPQVYSSSSSTKIGPNGVKETRKTLQDSRTGTKKMSIGHHIGERAHVIEREQNLYSGDREERQEFINLDEDEAEEFDREFQTVSSAYPPRRSSPARLALPPAPPSAAAAAPLAIRADPNTNSSESPRRTNITETRRSTDNVANYRPSARRPLRTSASPLTMSSASVREVYGGSHPQRHRHKHNKPSHAHRHSSPQ